MMQGLKLPEGLTSAWQLDCEVFAEAIRPDPELTITEWADRHRVLSPESSAEPGQWKTDRVPHAREIMDVLSPKDPTQEITFVAGTQVAKTEIGNNFIGFIIDVAPGPAMMVYPTSGTGKRSSKSRIALMIDAMPGLREKVSDKQRDSANSTTLKQFPGGVLAIAGANSAPDLKAMPVRYLFEDEVDEYPEDLDGQGPAIELAEKRTDTFPRKKIYRASTTTRKGEKKIWGFWLKSDQRKRFVPCPHCQQEQVLVWPQFRYETKKIWEVVRGDDGEIIEVPAGTEGAKERDTGQLLDVWYECEYCRGRIEERHKPWMFERGRWIAQRPEVKNHAGFHLPAFYSPIGWYSWWQAVEKRLEAERDPTKHLLKLWTNTVAAEPYEETGEGASDLELKERALESTYRRGTVPAGGLLLVAFADVQANRLEVGVKAYGRDKESWLVEYEVIFGDTETASPWLQLDEYLQRKFPHESGATLRLTAAGVDAGYRTQTVYDWVRPRAHRHIIACKGQSQAGKTILGRPTKQDIDHEGNKIPNGIDLWPIGADTAKSEIYARLKIKTPGPGCMHFPRGLPDEYFKGLTSERLVTRYVRGYPKRIWEKSETERNEPLDIEVGCYAMAIYAGVNRVNWDRMEAALRATAGDLFVQEQAKRDAAKDQPGADAAAAQRPEGPANAAADAAPQGARVHTSGQPRNQAPKPGFVNRWRS
jgi:phage terminase large subunit GpA-like protein